MKSLFLKILVVTSGVWCASMVNAGMEDDPLLGTFMLERLELRQQDSDTLLVWDAHAWLGKDINKVWIKNEGDYINNAIEAAEMQLLFNRAVARYWDAQVGWRTDIRPAPQRDWLVLGIHGLAPFFFDVDTAVFIGNNSRIGLRINVEYELLLTQKLALSSELEANLHGHNDRDTDTGSGLSDLELGLRLRYEIVRELAPYIGISGTKKYGNSAVFARNQGQHSDTIQWIVGVKAWY